MSLDTHLFISNACIARKVGSCFLTNKRVKYSKLAIMTNFVDCTVREHERAART